MIDTHSFSLAFNQLADPILILPFRTVDQAYAGFAIGLFVWSVVMTIIGEISGLIAYKLHSKRHAELLKTLRHHHNRSVEALHQGSKDGYLGHNKLAQDIYGKVFFSGVASFLATIWPVPFFMSWLNFRFNSFTFDIPFSLPYFENALRPEFFFLLIYVSTRLIFSRYKDKLPFFAAVARERQAEHGEFRKFLPEIPPNKR